MLDPIGTTLTSKLDGDEIVKAGLQGGEAASTLRLRFLVVPESARGEPAEHMWRLILTPLDRHVHESLPIEVRADAVMGLTQKGAPPADIDLSRWEGYDFGVSRRHLQLRPSEKSLYVIDLNSTNGTHVNGLPIGPSWAHALSTGDILTVGMLNLRITLLAMPRLDMMSQLG
jgi:hypothetical protein